MLKIGLLLLCLIEESGTYNHKKNSQTNIQNYASKKMLIEKSYNSTTSLTYKYLNSALPICTIHITQDWTSLDSVLLVAL